jgi:hypothetical protein
MNADGTARRVIRWPTNRPSAYFLGIPAVPVAYLLGTVSAPYLWWNFPYHHIVF